MTKGDLGGGFVIRPNGWRGAREAWLATSMHSKLSASRAQQKQCSTKAKEAWGWISPMVGCRAPGIVAANYVGPFQ